jgi:myo-inositol-1(or 4)-monophosphatase
MEGSGRVRHAQTGVAIRAAMRAGSILREMQGRVHIEFKGPIDLVTDADRAAERAIIEGIRAAYPDHAVAAEESGDDGTNECCWHIDPLDGTTNYAHGLPLYAVSLAMARSGEIQVGVIYVPATDELFVAERGGGAYRNGAPIRVSSMDVLGHSLMVTGFPYSVREDGISNLDHFVNFQLRTQAVRRQGSAALDLARVAQGAFDGYWETSLHPWDMAAGALLVEEAGGRLSTLRGEAWSLGQPQIVASNGHLHEAMLAVLSLGKTGMDEITARFR